MAQVDRLHDRPPERYVPREDTRRVLSVFVPPLRPYTSEKFTVLSAPASTPWHYSMMINQLWAIGKPFINIEHDMEADDEKITELLGCRHPNCTHAYRVHNIARSLSVYCQSRYLDMTLEPIPKGTGICDRSGIGFCKITPKPNRLNLVEWWNVESEVNQYVRLWHVHWPEVNHYHK